MFSARDRPGDEQGDVGIIDRVRGLATVVGDRVALRLEVLLDLLLEAKPGVVAADRYRFTHRR